jgi:hypothetical protein
MKCEASLLRTAIRAQTMSNSEVAGPARATEGKYLTIFGRSLLLVLGELTANVACWVVCAILFHKQGSILGLALLSWVSPLSSDFDKPR